MVATTLILLIMLGIVSYIGTRERGNTSGTKLPSANEFEIIEDNGS